MKVARALFTVFALATLCRPAPAQGSKQPVSLAPLFGRVWNITQAASQPSPGSIYIFLQNGTLLMTSCGEPYRVATWVGDRNSLGTLRITEDGRVTQSLTVTSVAAGVAHLTQTLLPGKTQSDLTLKSIAKEFVCPDLPK